MTAISFDIESLPVEIVYIGEMPSPWGDNKPRTVDAWRVTIGARGRSNTAGQWITTYYTATGLRSKTGRLRPPTVADVLYSLFTDAASADQNFSDWCADFGYSDDSIRALNIYKACTEIAQNLRRQFDPATRAQIQSIIEEM